VRLRRFVDGSSPLWVKALGLLDSSPLGLATARLLVRGVRLPFEPFRARHSHRRLSEVCRVIPKVLDEVGVTSDRDTGGALTVISATWSGTGAAIAKLGSAAGEEALVVKLAPLRTAPGLHRAAQAMRDLRADPRLGDFARLIPPPLGDGEIDGQAYAVERALPGVEARLLLPRPQARAAIVRAAAAAIAELHQRTGRTITVDAATRVAWVDRPAEVVARVSSQPRRVEALVAEVGAAWEGRRAMVSWIHGDYWPGNLLVTPDTGALTGIVDYEWAAPDALPQHDLLHLLVYTRMLTAGVELGMVVRTLLEETQWDLAEQRVLKLAPVDAVTDRSMMLLFWLRHVSLSLVQTPHYARDRVWMVRNVEQVLACC